MTSTALLPVSWRYGAIQSTETSAPLVLNGGSGVELQWLDIDGQRLDQADYVRGDEL